MLWAQLSIRWQMNKSRCELFLSFSLFSLFLLFLLFSLFEWESPPGDFLCSSFLHDDFASYFSPSAALAICCVVTSLGWVALLLRLSWRMTLLVAISFLFLIELDRGYDSLRPISCSPSTSSSRRDLSLSQVRSHPSTQIAIVLVPWIFGARPP